MQFVASNDLTVGKANNINVGSELHGITRWKVYWQFAGVIIARLFKGDSWVADQEQSLRVSL